MQKHVLVKKAIVSLKNASQADVKIEMSPTRSNGSSSQVASQ